MFDNINDASKAIQKVADIRATNTFDVAFELVKGRNILLASLTANYGSKEEKEERISLIQEEIVRVDEMLEYLM